MSKKKLNPQLLAEELKKFRMISEYSFYTGSVSEEEDAPEDEENAGGPAPDAGQEDPNAAADAIGGELGVDDSNTNGGEDPALGGGAGAPEAPAPAADAALAADPAPAGAPVPPMGAEAPAGDEVELDVTELVDGTEEAKNAAADASDKTSQLLHHFKSLEQKIASMGALATKIDAMEKEIVKRNPTPVEKLEMQSLKSFPYSVKLSDYWAEKEGPYDVMKDNGPEELTLTQGDVDASYSEPAVKKTFDINDYEEEDMV